MAINVSGRDITFTNGDTVTLEFNFKDTAGDAYVFAAGDTATLSVCEMPETSKVILVKTVTNMTTGKATFVISKADLQYCNAGYYIYDVRVKILASGVVITPFMPAQFNIVGAVGDV